MATIDYKCDTCKREITLVENSSGITVVGKCIITDGCRGRLYRTARTIGINNQYVGFPEQVAGLNDYVQRKVFVKRDITTTSAIWDISHDLGVSPAVTVYITDVDGEMSPDDYSVEVVSKDRIKITFDAPQQGSVHLVARTSIQSDVATITPAVDQFQVSHSGYLDLATISIINTATGRKFLTTDDFDIQIEVQIPSNPVTILTGENKFIKDQLDANSPWVGWEQVLVRKRRNFATKSFQVLDAFQEAFGDANVPNLSSIPDGSSFEIQKIRYRNSGSGYLGNFIDIEPRSVSVLLANAPYSTVDKIRDKLIDLGELLLSATGRFFIFGGEVFIDSSNIERMYPKLEQTSASNLLNTPTPTVTPTFTATPSVTPTFTATPTQTAAVTVTPTPTVTAEVTPSSTVTPSVGTSVTPTVTGTPVVTVTPTYTVTPSAAVTSTPVVTPTAAVTNTPVVSVTPSITASVTPVITQSVTPTITPSITPSSSIPAVVLLPWGADSVTEVTNVPGTTIQSGLVVNGHGVASASIGTWRFEKSSIFDLPEGPWWSQSGVNIGDEPLTKYQDFYIYSKNVTSPSVSLPFYSGNDAFDTWLDMGSDRSWLLEDTFTSATIHDIGDVQTWMVYSPNGVPTGDPSVSGTPGAVSMGTITMILFAVDST